MSFVGSSSRGARTSKSTSAAHVSSGTGNSSLSTAVAKQCLVAAVDRSPVFQKSAISFISDHGSIIVRKPESFIENHIVVEARSTDRANGMESTPLLSRVGDVALNCSSLALTTAATISTCGGTAVTLGASAPLCVLSAAGVGSSTWGCSVAVGQLINQVRDPRLADNLDHTTWWQRLNWAMTGLTLIADGVGFLNGVRKIAKIKAFAEAHNLENAGRFSINESKKLSTELGYIALEDFQKQGNIRRAMMARGHDVRFSNQAVLTEIRNNIYNANNTALVLDTFNAATQDKRPDWIRNALSNSDSPKDKYIIHVIQQTTP